MKKSAFTVLCFLLLIANSMNGFGQNSDSRIDSLKRVLAASKDDSNKVKTLLNLGASLLSNKPEESFSYSMQSLALAQKLNQKKAIIYSYQNMAGYYYHRGNIDSAELLTRKALDIIEQTNDKKALANAYNELSAFTNRRGDVATSLSYLKTALDLAKEAKDSATINAVLCNTGITYMGVSDYASALNYFMSALKTGQNKSHNIEMANCYLNIGKIYWLGYENADKTIYYAQLSLKAATECNDLFTSSLALQLLGGAYQLKKDWNKALDYFQQSLALNEKTGNYPIMADNMRSIATIYSEQNKLDKAIALMTKVIALSEKSGDIRAMGSSNGDMGKIYFKKKDYRMSIAYLNKSLSLARSIHMKNNEAVSLLDLANCYEAQKDYKNAFEALTQYKNVRDSVINDESINKTAQMDALYNFNKKEKEITLLTKDKEMQKMQINYLKIASLSGFILFTILFLLIYRNYRIRQSLKLQTLRNKLAIDLHDEVGSTLSSISIFSEIAREQSKEVAPLLDQIKENCRKIIESMADIVWTINPENDNFENIIIRMRSFAYELLGTKKINFEFNADNSITNMKLPMEARKNLYLIFKEATNNMVKYADADRASFSITGSKNNLTMLISDNGKGFEPEKETGGNGLKNMKARAMEMGAKFLIESTPGKGTTIQLLLKTA